MRFGLGDRRSAWWRLGLVLALAAVVLGEIVFHLSYPETAPFPYRSHGVVLLVGLAVLFVVALLAARRTWLRSRRLRIRTRATGILVVVAGAVAFGWAWRRAGTLTDHSMRSAHASPLFLTVVVAVEDPKFHQHRGLDLMSLHGALRRSVRSRHFAPGSPSLTLKLARRLVSPGTPTSLRWAQQALLAVALEARFEKSELLANYLDVVDFGMGQHGIGPAARFYFGKDAAQLELHESVVLVGLAADPPQEWLAEPSLREARTSVLRTLRNTPNLELDRTQLADAAAIPFGRFVLPYLTPGRRGATDALPARSDYVAFYSYATPDRATPVGLVAPRLKEQVLDFTREAHFLYGLVGVSHFGAYNDRLVRGSQSSVSSHAYGQAFDISGLELEDGRSLRVAEHDDPEVLRALAPFEELLRAYCDLLIDWREEPVHHQDHYHCEVKAERPVAASAPATAAR